MCCELLDRRCACIVRITNLAQHARVPQSVVDHDGACSPRRQRGKDVRVRHQQFIVLYLLGFVGIDENKVKGALRRRGNELFQCCDGLHFEQRDWQPALLHARVKDGLQGNIVSGKVYVLPDECTRILGLRTSDSASSSNESMVVTAAPVLASAIVEYPV